MCGIFGYIDKSGRPVAPALLEAAIATVGHRGPDGQGVFTSSNTGLAHARLAIIDLSERGEQPMHYRAKVIIYNGEIYNYRELRQELEKAGHRFTSDTDTEVILAAYDEWGPDCVDRFNGMWAFAIYDPKEERLFCSRDRFGIKPFYYLDMPGFFSWASEIKQFRKLPDFSLQMNGPRVFEFLVHGYHDHTPETCFASIRQLPAGCNLFYSLSTHQLRISPFYDPAKAMVEIPGSREEAVDRFAELFRDSVRLRLRADVKVGTSLSGGLDSSSVIGTMASLHRESSAIESVSICFPEERYSEEAYIDAVATRHQLTSHKVFPGFGQVLGDLAQVTWYQDEPIASPSVIAQHYVFREAANHGIKVMLDGQGADEILGGYEKFYLPYFRQLLRYRPWQVLPALFFVLRTHRPDWRIASYRLQQYLHRKEPTANWIEPAFRPAAADRFRRQPDKDFRSCSLNLLREVGLPILLHYEDRNAMAASVESRFPFLDHRLVEFALSLPPEFKIRAGKRKFILREAMRDVLPAKVYARHDKMGFETPSDLWMEQQPAFFQNRLQAAITKNREIFRPAALDLTRQVLQKKDRRYYPLLWRIIAFAAWREVFEVSG